MDAFDIVFEEIASTKTKVDPNRDLSKQEPPANQGMKPIAGMPGAQKKSAQAKPKLKTSKALLGRERSAIEPMIPAKGMPTARNSPSTIDVTDTKQNVSNGRRQANSSTRTARTMPAGTKNTEGQFVADTQSSTVLGDDGGAHLHGEHQANHPPTVVQVSDSHSPPAPQCANAVGRDQGAHWASASQKPLSPLVAQNSGSRSSTEPQAWTAAGEVGTAQIGDENLLDPSRPDFTYSDLDGLLQHGTHCGSAVEGDQGAQSTSASQRIPSPLVATIVANWRMRQRWHRAEKSLILQGKAMCRSWTDGDKDAANALFAKAEKDTSGDRTLDLALMPFLAAIERFETERSRVEKDLRKLAQSHPLWPWVAEVKGFGALNLAALLGEAGNPARYRNPSCLWKRMGLAVIDGGRQRRVADAEKALVHGYAPARRCVAYLLGDTLIKAGDGCRYRPVYTARREHTAGTHPDWTKAHSHNDAARYMVKRVLRDLWSEARRVRRLNNDAA